MNNEKNITNNPKHASNNQKNFGATLRVFDTELDPTKVVRFALLRIFGIGLYRSKKICEILGINDSMRVKDLKEEDVLRIQNAAKMQGYAVANDLKHELMIARSRLNSTRCLRAERHKKGLPCRGQRTHSNGNTASRLRGKA